MKHEHKHEEVLAYGKYTQKEWRGLPFEVQDRVSREYFMASYLDQCYTEYKRNTMARLFPEVAA